MISTNAQADSTQEPDYTLWEIGPYHSALPAQLRLRLHLDGEVIARCEVETGFLHRGLEKALELHSWKSAIAYVDHLDSEVAVFGEMALCLAVEEIAEIQVPPRAQAIRIILSELTRISAYLNYFIKMARAVGSETICHYLLRDREKILDLFELLTGARFSLNFLRFGGVFSDVTDGFVERVIEVCDLIRIRMKEYNDLFTYNHAFLKRSVGIGVLPQDLIKNCGITGPNARASSVRFDVRKESPYSGYQLLDFDIPSGKGEQEQGGDVHNRFLQRMREISQSMEILLQVTEHLPKGEYLNSKLGPDMIVPPGEAYARVESSRGLLGCHVVSDGKANPNRIQFRAPSVANLIAVPDLVRGIRIEDLPVVLGSLDLGIAEADR